MRQFRFVLALALVLAASMVVASDEILTPLEPEGRGPSVLAGTQNPPEYPPAALAARFEGTVVLAVEVRSDGSVGDVELVSSTSPRLGFEAAAERAVSSWRFLPATIGGQAVDSYVLFRWNFHVPGTARRPSPLAASSQELSALAGRDASLVDFADAARSESTLSPSSHGGGREAVRKYGLPPAGGLYDRRSLIPLDERLVQPSPAGL